MSLKTAGAAVYLMTIVAPAAVGATVTLTPSKDNTIIQWSPAGLPPNLLLANGQGDLYVGRTNQDGQEAATISIRRGLVHFDLTTAVPSGMKIVAATLTLRDVRGRNGDPIVRLHRVLSDWGEGGSFFEGGQGSPAQESDVTWLHTFYNAATPSASLTWNTVGGDFEPAASAESIVTDDLGEGQLSSWSGAGLVADLEAWLETPAMNFGWMLLGDELHGQTVKRFNSGESSESPSVPPQLAIEFSPLLSGDYNDNGIVDAADYTVWRDGFGGPGPLENETVTRGLVTSEDYVIWKIQFGAVGAGVDSVVPVPEPSACGTVMVGTIVVCSCFHRSMHYLGDI